MWQWPSGKSPKTMPPTDTSFAAATFLFQKLNLSSNQYQAAISHWMKHDFVKKKQRQNHHYRRRLRRLRDLERNMELNSPQRCVDRRVTHEFRQRHDLATLPRFVQCRHDRPFPSVDRPKFQRDRRVVVDIEIETPWWGWFVMSLLCEKVVRGK